MKDDSLFVYICSEDHLNYAESKPKECKVCGSPRLEVVYGVTVNKEIKDVIPEESKYHSYQE
jgi:hypothetical protein